MLLPSSIHLQNLHRTNLYFNHLTLSHNVDFHSDDDPLISRQDLFRWHASMFVVNLKESCSISQTTIEKVIEGAQQLIEKIMSIMKVSMESFYCKMLHVQEISYCIWGTLPIIIFFFFVNDFRFGQ